MSHTRRPTVRLKPQPIPLRADDGETIADQIITEVLHEAKCRTHVIVGDHAPEPRR